MQMFSWFRVSEQVERVEQDDIAANNDLRKRQFEEITAANKTLRLQVTELNALIEENKAASTKNNALLTEAMAKNETLQTDVSITNEALLTANQQHSAQLLLIQCQHGEEIKKHEQLQEAFDEKVLMCIQQTQQIEELTAQLIIAQDGESKLHLLITAHELAKQQICAMQESEQELIDNQLACKAEIARLQTHIENAENVAGQMQSELNQMRVQCSQKEQEVLELKAQKEEYQQCSHELVDLKDKSLELTLQNQEYELEIDRLKDDEAQKSTELAIELMRNSLKKKEEEILTLHTSLKHTEMAKKEAEETAEKMNLSLKKKEEESLKLCASLQCTENSRNEEILQLRASLKRAEKAKNVAEEALNELRDSKPELQQTKTEPMVHGDRELKERLQSEAAHEQTEIKRGKRARSDTEIEPEDAPSRKRQRVSSSSRSAKAKDDSTATITEVQATYAPRKKCAGTTFVGTERFVNGKSVQFTCKWLVGNGEECLFTCTSKAKWRDHCIQAHTHDGKPITTKIDPWMASSISQKQSPTTMK